MAGKIFVNYRRDDSAANALSIAQYLEREFGSANVFLDIDRMRAGQRFPKVLEERLAVSKVMLVVIGPSWLSVKNEAGLRRLDDPEDWVRLEIGRALARGIPVIPVLVGGASLPKKSDLPDELKPLIEHQIATVTTKGFRAEMACLARDLRTELGPHRRWPLAAGVAASVVAAAGLAMYAGLIPMLGLATVLRGSDPAGPAPGSEPAAQPASGIRPVLTETGKQQESGPSAGGSKLTVVEARNKAAEARRRIEEAKAKRVEILDAPTNGGAPRAAPGNDAVGPVVPHSASAESEGPQVEDEQRPAEPADAEQARRQAQLQAERLAELEKPGAASKSEPDAARAAATPKVGETFRDCPECPEMVVVPAGEFVMGSPETEKGRGPNEGPQRRISLAKTFAVGRYETTVAEYQSFIDDTGGVAVGGGCAVWTAYGHRVEPDRSFKNPSFSQSGRHPVVCVSWQAAVAYTDWLSRKTSKKYRLPSEAEWEYVARANSADWYYSGNNVALLCQYGNGADRTSSFKWGNLLCSDGAGVQTAEVGKYLPNSFGIYDTIGNVWEWVQDCSSKDLRSIPDSGEASNFGDCTQRGIRGGSWDNAPEDLRSAVRGSHNLGAKDNIGFRVARTLSP